MYTETWVSIKDKLPGPDKSYVRVRFTIRGRARTSNAYYSKGQWHTGEWSTIQAGVTHWLDVQRVGKTPISAVKVQMDTDGAWFVRVNRSKYYQATYPFYSETISNASLRRAQRAQLKLAGVRP